MEIVEKMKIKDIGEIALIERFRKRIRLDSSVVKGSGDDAAVIRWRKDKYLLFTCDMLIENIHFEKKTAPYQVGRKALAVNISDIAAMGGVPKQAVISLGLPGKMPVGVVDKIFSGMKEAADKFGVNIVGGDVNTSANLCINVALLGEVKKDEFVTRSGAKRGDVIMVTGQLGGSKYGKHLGFTPRVKEARYLVRNFRINSMMDISDGLSSDIFQICRASKVGAVIYESLIPVSQKAKSINNALNDGEDFELLLTLPKRYAGSVIKRFRKNTGTGISAIGKVVPKSKGVNLITRFGKARPLGPGGFSHF